MSGTIGTVSMRFGTWANGIDGCPSALPASWPITRATTSRTYYALADAYTICDANYCSVMGPTFPNRLYLFTGMNDPNRTGGGPSVNNVVPTNGFNWTTYPERLEAAGVDWKIYRQPGDWFGDALAWFAQFQNAAPGNPLYDRGMVTANNVVTAFKRDVTNGTLPQVSWIMPPWNNSEHPSESPFPASFSSSSFWTHSIPIRPSLPPQSSSSPTMRTADF